jgi:integrase
VKGLYLQISNPANKSWVLRYQFEKRPRNLGLGPFPLIGLQLAREKAREIQRNIKLDKTDPLERRKEEQAARVAQRTKVQTFKEAAERFYQKSSLEWKTDSQRRAFRSTMEAYVFTRIGDMDVAAIDTPAVLRVLEPIWQAKPTVANLLRIRIEKILTMAAVGGYRGSGDNPARWTGHLSEMLPSHAKIKTTQSHAALPYRELPKFITALRSQKDGASMALEFIILTAARKQEALGATWDEIDLEERLWTIPAARMKGGRKHEVPLSTDALAILNSLPRESDNLHVFICAKAGAGLSDGSLRKLLKRLGGELTVHGFRSTFRDWAGDHTQFPREIAEAALAHAVGDATEQAYRRGSAVEKRRVMMEAWAAYCASGTGSSAGGTVVDFKGARRA